jgi:hypothetical protein
MDNPIETLNLISRSLNPVWSLSTGSLFLLRQNAENFFETNYLDFEIRDYDPILADTALGRVSVGKHEMLNGKGKRVEYPFEACYGSAIKDPAKQVCTVNLAYDIIFFLPT